MTKEEIIEKLDSLYAQLSTVHQALLKDIEYALSPIIDGIFDMSCALEDLEQQPASDSSKGE